MEILYNRNVFKKLSGVPKWFKNRTVHRNCCNSPPSQTHFILHITENHSELILHYICRGGFLS